MYKYVVCKYVVMTDGSTVMWCCTIVVTDVDHIANTNLPIYIHHAYTNDRTVLFTFTTKHPHC